ncbi:RNA polymerase II [Patellaria atrata CBS 101060]|uniref:RNA polymerase II n=1 Tax=Patellaria atrata CBS 101060 TaxID=1346257 RepID=A0A9P4S616_9PEZI|nr:RNA polymerase II [Patellaria atrata CBS 101060]
MAHAHARPTIEGDEEAAAELRLGEFHDVPTMSLSEAHLVIKAVIDKRRAEAKPEPQGETINKMQDYLAVFARFKNQGNIHMIEQTLNSRTVLDPFERSQLGTLCCESADEAKTLIPSLTNKISDSDLQDLLDEITRLRFAE